MKKEFGASSPESAGIRSADISRLVDGIIRKQKYIHSLLIVHGDDIVAEGYVKPFDENKLHRLYSCSKSFVSIAVGFLCDEGKISLDDKVIKYFPDKLPEKLHPFIEDMRIKDLLTMQTCYGEGTTYRYTDKDWAWTFFNSAPVHPAGTVFGYDTSGSYILDVIVERVTGMPFIEYLKEKAFRKMGIDENIRCIKAPEGYSWGGSGVLCKLRDFAKVAKFMLDYGRWDGEQLLSEEYVRTATSRVVDNDFTGHPTAVNFGYGYQFWQIFDGCFAFLGMGGQLAICVREKNLIFVCNADCQNNSTGYHNIINEFFESVVWNMSDAALPESPDEHRALEAKLRSLVYPHIDGRTATPTAQKIAGKKYILQDNRMGIKNISFSFDGDCGELMYENAQGSKTLRFGIGRYLETEFPQDGYYGDTIGKDGGKRYECICSGGWTEEKKLKIKADIVDDYFGNVCMTFGFKGDTVTVLMSKCAEWFLDEYNGTAWGVAEGVNV